MSSTTIVVGYDGSASAAQALTWALDEAAHTHAAVELLYAWARPLWPPAITMLPGTGGVPEAEQAINRMLVEVADAAQVTHPGVTVRSAVAHGPAAQMLRERARDAGLLVLGTHSRGAVAGVALGSVCGAVATHAACPVIGVRDGRAPHGPVVVGLDESSNAELAAGFAFDQAAAHGVGVRAIRAWMPPPDPWIGTDVVDREAISTTERVAVEQLLAGWREKFPTVEVTIDVVVGHPYRVLTNASRDARLVVVAARGSGDSSLRLGSVSRHLLHHSACTVAIVRDATM